MFVTYDLQLDASHERPMIVRGAKEFQVPGRVLRWDVGEFEGASGKKIFGVKLVFEPERDPDQSEIELVEVPAHAQKVQVHLGPIPPEYRSALKSAV